MLNHPTLDKLEALRFNGIAKALTEQTAMADIGELSFEERLSLLVNREMSEREDLRLKTSLSRAKLRQSACVEDIDYRQRQLSIQKLNHQPEKETEKLQNNPR